ncbi:MAG: choline dehydrogenase [Pseudomonadota bacterium]
MDNADIVIVGAGSAGCVLANRLSAHPSTKVLLIEAGPRDGAVSLRAPAAMVSNLTSTKYNWAFAGAPEPGLDGRSFQHDRGKVLGGSSSINGMCWIRGHARDFDGWRQRGCTGWGWADVLPYFRRCESIDGGDDGFRGRDGPMRVVRPAADTPLARAFLEAGRQAGYRATADINGQAQEGFGVFERSVHRGQRWSTARGYLDPVIRRDNLDVRTDLHVERVRFQNGRAQGIVVSDRHGTESEIHAAKEVILCAGAVGSPHILMVSGIGPAAHLTDHGIRPLVDRPGVGQNLNDHPDYVLKWRCLQPVTLWQDTQGLRKAMNGLQWLVTGQGAAATNHFDTVATVRSRAGIDYPDLQFTLAPIAMDGLGWTPVQGHAFQIHVGLMRAQGRGAVTLNSADPRDPPRILCNYLTDPNDLATMIRGVRLVREIAAQPAFDPFRGDEIEPGPAAETDADIEARLRACTVSQWHLSCTARMGPADDPDAVVDTEGRVIGVSGLRVVDASIMPEVVNANTNATTIMIAEKISDAILGKTPLPPDGPEAQVALHPNWDAEQR